MSAFGSPTEITVLNHLFAIGTAWSQPSSLYCALFTDAMAATDLEKTTPTLTSEISGNGYARVDLLTGTPKFNSTATTNASWVTSLDNTSAIAFAQATGNWADGSANTTIRYVAIMSSSSGAGTVYLWGQLVSDQTILTNDTFTFATGDLIITLD